MASLMERVRFLWFPSQKETSLWGHSHSPHSPLAIATVPWVPTKMPCLEDMSVL